MVSKLQIIKIDATNKKIGRLATEVSNILTGKKFTNYRPEKIAKVLIEISNIDKLYITNKQLENNYNYKYSGYSGSLKKEYWNKIYKKSPGNLFLKILDNMLPKNKSHKKLLANIKFS